MTIQSATPESGSIVQRGEIITIVWDSRVPGSGGAPTIVYEPSGGQPQEQIYVGGSGAFQTGYTGTQVFDNFLWTLSFKRNAGWGTSAFGIAAYYATTRNDLSYTILAEGQYPPDMQPFNDPAAQVGTGEMLIQDSGVAKGSATTLNLAENLTAAVSGGVATINADDTGTDITVLDETQTVTQALTQLTLTGAGVSATGTPDGLNPGHVTVIIPGTEDSGQAVEVIGTINVSGGNVTTTANSIGLAAAGFVNGTSLTVEVHYATDFASTDYFVQLSPISPGTASYFPTIVSKLPGYVTMRMWDSDASTIIPLNPITETFSFDIIAQSEAGSGGSGDVQSSETAGTVQNGELTVFDGTSGKLIKGAGTGVYSANGTVHANWIFGQSGVSAGGPIAISSPTAVLDMNEYVTGAPTEIGGAGRWWVRNETGAANTPMFTDGAGTEYDLTSGTAGTVDTVVGGTGISVNSADSANPIVSTDDGAIVHDSLSGFVAAEHLDWSSDLGGTQVHANNYTSGSGITSWNTLTGAVTSIYVQAADPDLTITPNPGDVWIEIP